MTIKQRFKALKKSKKDLEKQIQKLGKEFFAEETKSLFAKHPELKTFAWVQFTPYFNDGETCYFSADLDTIYINEDEDDEGEGIYAGSVASYIKSGKDWDDKPFTPTANDLAAVDVSKFLNQFDEDLLEDIFGDHVKVVVHRNGKVEKQEYDHD
jgi:hypothetical protein